MNDPAIQEKIDAGEVEDVNWDDPRVAQAAKDIEDFATKGYFSENIASNVYPAGQNQEFAPGEACNYYLRILAAKRNQSVCKQKI